MNTKLCPHCKAELNAKVEKCYYCDSKLDDRPLRFRPLRGETVLIESSLSLNKREEKALDAVISNFKAKNPEFTKKYIKRFIVAKKPYYAGNVEKVPGRVQSYLEPRWNLETSAAYITLECLHVEAEKQEETNGLFKTLIFPGATVNQNLLNTACLLFDKIYVIFPDEGVYTLPDRSEFSQSLSNTEYQYLEDEGTEARPIWRDSVTKLLRRLTKFLDETLSLRRCVILNLISPFENLSSKFYRSVINDLNDQAFCDTVRQHKLPDLLLGGSKAWGRTLEREPIHDLSNTNEIDRHLLKGLYHYSSKGHKINGRISAERKVFWEEYLQLFLENTNINRWGLGGWGFIRANPVLGSSLLLNHSLLACTDRSLIPISDNNKFFDLLSYKVDQLSDKAIAKEYMRERSQISTILADRVLEEQIPTLSLKSLDDVLELREKYYDSLLNFRRAIRYFAAEVKSKPYSKDFQREIENIVARKVNPAIGELRRELADIPKKFLATAMKGLKVGTLPLIAAAFIGVPPAYLLALSAGFVSVEAFLEVSLSRKKKTMPYNGLAFLLKIK